MRHIGAMIELAVKVENLVKHYSGTVAVDGISFAVGRGVTAALLGGNGAGKTTTLSILLGLLLPTAGQVRVLGEDMLRHRYRVLPRMNFSSPFVDLPHRRHDPDGLAQYGRSRAAVLGRHDDEGRPYRRSGQPRGADRPLWPHQSRRGVSAHRARIADRAGAGFVTGRGFSAGRVWAMLL